MNDDAFLMAVEMGCVVRDVGTKRWRAGTVDCTEQYERLRNEKKVRTLYMSMDANGNVRNITGPRPVVIWRDDELTGFK